MIYLRIDTQDLYSQISYQNITQSALYLLFSRLVQTHNLEVIPC